MKVESIYKAIKNATDALRIATSEMNTATQQLINEYNKECNGNEHYEFGKILQIMEAKQQLNSEFGLNVNGIVNDTIILGGRGSGKTYNAVDRLIEQSVKEGFPFVYINDVQKYIDFLYVFEPHKRYSLSFKMNHDINALMIKHDEKVLGFATTKHQFDVNADFYVESCKNIVCDDFEIINDDYKEIDFIIKQLQKKGFNGFVTFIGRRFNR